MAGGGRQGRRDGPADASRLGDQIQRARPDGLINVPTPGAPAKFTTEHRAFLARIVDEGPTPPIHGVVRWRACDLIMRLHEEFGISVSDDTVYRALKDLGFSHVSARPRAYKQDPEAIEAFKKDSTLAWRKRAKALATLGGSSTGLVL
ncbi:winged helix-turn-helix domain-containing protein [Bradyrhizobium genosp. P]|uniref:winged helix-turn-helix domain-containing protein n=1 Tax=Bradyrhizobium genosp. P TaxID=83641 RepID=UPI003CF1A853